MTKNTFATVIQIISIIACCIGILIEFLYFAELGFLLITFGGVMFGISTKIRKERLKREIKELKGQIFEDKFN